MISNISNAVKVLPKFDNKDSYIKLYTNVNSNFVVGDKIYICSYDENDANFDLDNYLYYTANSGNGNGNIVCEQYLQGYLVKEVDSDNNSIVINRLYSTLFDTSNITNENFFISKTIMLESIITGGEINGVVLKNTNITNTLNNIKWIQGIVLGGIITNLNITDKYTNKTLSLNTVVNNGDISSFYTYNNGTYGYSVFLGKTTPINIGLSNIDNGYFYNTILTGFLISTPTNYPIINNGYYEMCEFVNNFKIFNGYYKKTKINSISTLWYYGVFDPENISTYCFNPIDWYNGVWESSNTPTNMTWHTGTFNGDTFISSCLWIDGIFNGNLFLGVWMTGVFNKGIFSSNLWSGGVFNNGVFSNGMNWTTGVFNNGTFYGNWTTGVFNGGIFGSGATWYNGVFNGGKFTMSNWINGNWYNGIFDNSTWMNGNWYGGSFENSSIWNNGVFNNGTIKNSTWNNGIFYFGEVDQSFWYNGTWYNGIMTNSYFYGGNWLNGVFTGGDFESVWETGSFNSGIFNGGTWHNGVWYNGSFSSGTWLNGVFYLGSFSGTGSPTILNKAFEPYQKQHFIRRLNKSLTMKMRIK
jgi:hypothetical protein